MKPTSQCRRCKRAPWVCRQCGRPCCEHRVTLKKPDGTALCGRCRLISPQGPNNFSRPY